MKTKSAGEELKRLVALVQTEKILKVNKKLNLPIAFGHIVISPERIPFAWIEP